MSAQSEAHSSRIVRRLGISVVLLLTPAAAASAGDWVAGPKSEARLVDGGLYDGVRYALVQIRLAGDAVTYWRDPGEAGAPSTFDFAGSDNLGEAEAVYPQPKRIDEDGSVAFGYRHEVSFPIRVTPDEASKPVALDLKLDYAVCEKICIPVHAQLTETLPPEPTAPASDLLEAALKLVPKALDADAAARFATAEAMKPANDKPQWRIRIAEGEARDLFVEPPAGFYFEVKPAGERNAFLLTLVEHPAKRLRPEAPLRLTVTGPEAAEFDLVLPAPKT